MFESVIPDPGEDGLRRASRIFYVIAGLSVVATGLLIVVAVMSGRLRLIQPAIYAVFGVVAYLTGKGIENQRPWAKWAGIVLGVLELFNFPVGTVIGIAILIYLNRAIKANLFVTSPTTTAERPTG